MPSRKKPKPKTTSATDDAIAKLDAAQGKISEADALISDAIELLHGAPPPVDPTVIHVAADDDLLTAIDDAPAGATLSIDPSLVCTIGTITLDKTIRLVNAAPLPLGRVGLDLAGPQLLEARLTMTAPSIELVGLRIQGQGQTIITAGDATVLDRCLIVAEPGQQQQRGIAANAEDILITGCHIGGIYKDVDTQAVCCWNKTKRLTIHNCFLEAAGENFMSGGSDPESEDAVPRDILIEDCTLSKPTAWMQQAGCTVKNLFELKNVIGCIVRRCVFENCWADGQAGYAFKLSVRNQSGTAPYTVVQDVLIEDCSIAHVGAGISILGRDDINASQVMNHVTIRRVTMEDIGKHWATAPAVAAARAITISGGPDRLVLEDVNANLQPGASMNAAIGFDQAQHLCTGLVFRRCEWYEGAYGITGTAPGGIGLPQLEGHAPGYLWEDGIVQQGTSGRKITYPPDTDVRPPVGAVVFDGDPDGLDR